MTSTTSVAKQNSKRNKLIALAAALVVAIIGYTLVISRASGFFVSVKPEDVTRSGNASLVTIGDQKAIQFNTPVAPPTNPPPTPPSARPNESNTGYIGAKPTRVWTGPQWDGSSNLVIEGYVLNDFFTFAGSNVTIKNSYLSRGVQFNGKNVVLENNEIIGGVSLSGTQTVSIRKNKIHSFGSDGVHITSDTGRVQNVTFADNLVYKPKPVAGAHADGMQVRGVSVLDLVNNTFDMGPWVTVNGQDVLNAALFLQDANGGNDRVTLRDNYLNGGGYIFYLGAGPQTRLINNRFGQGHYGFVNNTSRGDVDLIEVRDNKKDATGVCLVQSEGLNGCRDK